MTAFDKDSKAGRETAKRDPERWLSAIVESSDDAIVGESLSGEITSWNAAAERIFGYTSDEIIGKSIRLLAWPGQEGDISYLLDRVRNGQRVEHQEVLRRHKDGSKLNISLSLSPVRDDHGEIIGMAKIARDITERRVAERSLRENKKALEELREQEASARAEVIASRRFKEMIESAPDAILELDQGGKILIANRTAERIFGYAKGDLIGLSVGELVPLIDRGAHAARRHAFMRAGLARPVGKGLDLAAARKDGSSVPVEISLSPMRTNAGVHTIAVIRDISERRRSDEQVRSLQESYMQELEARQMEADRLNRLKSEFLASVSHELRTPLHTIIGFAELLGEQSDGKLNEQQLRFLHHIQRDSEHLLGLINDVLDLSRIEAGGLSLHTEELSLGWVIQQAIEGIAPYASARSVAVQSDALPEICVRADAGRLRQVIDNLLSNAVKFTPAGGRVQVSAVIAGDVAEVCVKDTGVGIAPSELGLIFDKFYQVGTTAGGVREGTGLGLAICRQLVEMHGGTIRVESEPHLGSRFFFTLPLVKV